jgi:hypothetical protein
MKVTEEEEDEVWAHSEKLPFAKWFGIEKERSEGGVGAYGIMNQEAFKEGEGQEETSRDDQRDRKLKKALDSSF